jgi:hypothetical protein
VFAGRRMALSHLRMGIGRHSAVRAGQNRRAT